MSSQDLRAYLMDHIREIYKGFDNCHDQRHFDEVYLFTDVMCRHLGFNEHTTDIMLTAAAFHDTGRIVNDDIHEELSAKILRRDKFVKLYFNEDDISSIASIILAHRSSHQAFNMFEELLKDADMASRLIPSRHLYRMVAYHDNPNSTYEEIYEDVKRASQKKKSSGNWHLKKSEEVYGVCPEFVIPDFEWFCKYVDSYREGRILIF